MRRSPKTLTDYYRDIKLNPVRHDVSSAENFAVHERKRKNLIERHLRLPFSLWKGARVLEFGPASGENTIVWAHHGAKLTLVEPLAFLLEELRRNFKRAGLTRQIEKTACSLLENYKSAEKHEIVVAEGFIQFLADAPAAVRRLSSFVAPEGFLMVSSVHPSGTFIEYVKRVFLGLMSARLNARSRDEQRKLAALLFGEQFGKINHSRGFESWAQDTILNPLYRPHNFMDIDEILGALPGDFYLYSSWPNYLDMDDLVWHKTIKDRETVRRATLDAYYSRCAGFLHSIPREQKDAELLTPTEGLSVLRALRQCLVDMDAAVETRSPRPENIRAALEPLRRSLKKAPRAAQSLAVVEDAIAVFHAARNADSLNDFQKAWAGSRRLKRLWGSPGHYYVFHRSDLFPPAAAKP